MSLPDVEPWQVPLIVTGVVVLAEIVVSAVAKRFRPRFPNQWKTGLLALLGIGGLFFASVTALGASMADHLSSTAGGIATLASVWLAYRAYYSSREQRPKAKDDEPEPEPVADPAPPSDPPDPQPAPHTPADGLFAEWKRSRRKTRNRT